MLLRRQRKSAGGLLGLGTASLSLGLVLNAVAIVLNRRAAHGKPLPGEVCGLPLDDVVVIALSLAGSVLVGVSIVLNISGLKSSRR